MGKTTRQNDLCLANIQIESVVFESMSTTSQENRGKWSRDVGGKLRFAHNFVI